MSSRYFEKERLGTLDVEATTPEGVGVKVKRKPPGNPGHKRKCPGCNGIGLVHD